MPTSTRDLKLIQFLILYGHENSNISVLPQNKRIFLALAGKKEKTLVPSEAVNDIDIGYGDKVYIGSNMYHYRAKLAPVKSAPYGRAGNGPRSVVTRISTDKWIDSHKLEVCLGLAGGTGLILGGPLSALLAYFAAQFVIREETKMHGRGHSKILPFRFGTFWNWIAIGSLAMPASWFISSSLGWNLDVLAVVHSQGGFKSYKDWSEAEEKESKAERERKQSEYEAKKLEEDANFEQWRLKKAAREAAAIARQQRDEAQQKLRLDAEMREYNDPVKSADREQRHMEHLESVGCLDMSGQVIRTRFCLNTEAPPQR